MKLRGKTALVTGAARRIGRAIALSLANQGVDIIVHCNKSVKEARLLCREIQQKGVASWLLRADLADSDDLCSVVPIALESAKKLDIIINNASVFTESTLTDLTREDFMKNIDTNAWAPLLISRDFYRLSGRGSIINILDSRIAGFDQAHVGYIFSKHMLAEMTRYMAMAFAPEITVNAVAPGLILQPQGKTSADLVRLSRSLPLECHGNPSDVAAAVLFLLGSKFVTGQVINVDGGRHVRKKG